MRSVVLLMALSGATGLEDWNAPTAFIRYGKAPVDEGVSLRRSPRALGVMANFQKIDSVQRLDREAREPGG
jgi:hypothetical protein